jgi:hypothetical protein
LLLQREDAFLPEGSAALLTWIRTAKDKQILLSRVAMKVTVEEDGSAIECLSYHLFDCTILRKQSGGRGNPLSIKVVARERRPIVAYNYAIRIYHGNYFEDKALSEIDCASIIANEVVDEALHDEGGVGFTRVDSSGQDDGWSNSDFLWLRREVSNNYHIAVVAC